MNRPLSRSLESRQVLDLQGVLRRNILFDNVADGS